MDYGTTEIQSDPLNSVRQKELLFAMALLDLNFREGNHNIADVVRQVEFRSHSYLRQWG